MKIVFPLIFVILFSGCPIPRPSGVAIIIAEVFAEKSAYHFAKKTKMNLPSLIKTTRSIDEVSKVLTVTMPPDFEGTRKMIETKNKGPAGTALVITVDLVENRSRQYLQGEEQNMEKAREMIDAVFRGSKRGFRTYQLEISPIQTSSADE